jgi:hypothetical protein
MSPLQTSEKRGYYRHFNEKLFVLTMVYNSRNVPKEFFFVNRLPSQDFNFTIEPYGKMGPWD